MKKHTLIAFILCFAALAALCGCTQNTPDAAQTPAQDAASVQAATAADTAGSVEPQSAVPASGSDAVPSLTQTDTQSNGPEPGPDTQMETETETTGQPMGPASGQTETWTSADGSWSVDLPGSWSGLYTVNEEAGVVIFIDIANAEAGFGGALFTVQPFAEEETWDFIPDFAVLGESGGMTYVVSYPTDVQCSPDDPQLQSHHEQMIDGLTAWLPASVHFDR